MSLSVQDFERIETRINEMKTEVPQKAAADPEFHDALMADPKAAIEKYYGFPAGTLQDINLQIFEEAPASIGLVIPPRPNESGEELSEDQLEAVSGGAVFCVKVGVAVITGVSAVASTGVASGWGNKE